MLDRLAKVTPGQRLRIPAEAYNAFVDAAKANKGIKQDIGRGASREHLDGVTLIKNTSGSAIQRFGVLGVDGPLFDPLEATDAFRREVALTASTPALPAHSGKFVIALEPIADGAIGRACAAGVCVTQVKFPDPNVSQPEFADIHDATTDKLLAQERGAARVLWHETVPAGGGTVWAIVRVGDSNASSMFPVDLTQVGGTDGNDVGPATWTYDVFDALDTAPMPPALATAVDPTAAPSQWARPATGAVVKATAGLAFFDPTGALALTWINEVFSGGGAGGDFQAFFVHAVRVGGVVTAPPIVNTPDQITYDIKADPVGPTADFTGVAPTHARETNPTGQIIAASAGDVCAAKIGLDGQQNPIVDELILLESEPQRLLVANDDEPGATIIAPWVGNAGSLVNNPTRLEATPDGQGGTTLKLITQALTMALKPVLPTAAAGPDQQDQADPFANKLVLGSSLSATEQTLSTVTIAGGADGITSFNVVFSNLLQQLVIGSFHSGGPTIVGTTLQFPRKKISMSASVTGSLATLTVAVTSDGFDSVPLKVGD